MAEVYHSMMKNKTWDLFPRLQANNIVKCWWVYKTKFTYHDVIERHKACLVAKNFCQQEGINYCEIFPMLQRLFLLDWFSFAFYSTWIEGTSNWCQKCISSWRSEWRNLWRTPILFVDWKNTYMVWNRPPGLGTRRMIVSLSILASNNVN